MKPVFIVNLSLIDECYPISEIHISGLNPDLEPNHLMSQFTTLDPECVTTSSMYAHTYYNKQNCVPNFCIL